MRQVLLLLVALMLLAGCGATASGGGQPKAVVPELKVDFGNVPVSSNMNDAKIKRFLIQNAGTGNLRFGQVQVKLLDGC